MRSIILVLLLVVLSWADHDYDDHHIPKDLSYLKLSGEQYEAVKTVLYAYKHDLKAFRREKKAHERSVRELFTRERFDREGYAAASLALEKKAVAIQSDFLEKIHAILTPGQRERFLYYFDEWDVD